MGRSWICVIRLSSRFSRGTTETSALALCLGAASVREMFGFFLRAVKEELSVSWARLGARCLEKREIQLVYSLNMESTPFFFH